MTEENSRPERDPKEKEKTQEQKNDRVETKPNESWEREKRQGKEIVSKALKKVRNRLENQ